MRQAIWQAMGQVMRQTMRQAIWQVTRQAMRQTIWQTMSRITSPAMTQVIRPAILPAPVLDAPAARGGAGGHERTSPDLECGSEAPALTERLQPCCRSPGRLAAARAYSVRTTFLTACAPARARTSLTK